MVLGGGSDCSTTVHTCFTAAAAGESLLLESAFRSRAREFGRGSCCFGRRGSALGWAGWLRLPLIAINHSCCCYLRSALCLGFAVRFRRERETWFSVARVRAWVFDCDGCWGDGGDDDGYGEGLCEYGVRGWAEVVWIRGRGEVEFGFWERRVSSLSPFVESLDFTSEVQHWSVCVGRS